jgi:glucosamine--fructose-6-phosphate aminotransferase (isomerizing)
MCGIIGYIGENDAYPFLIKGLKWLEYRGYDSAGMALFNGHLSIFRKMGKVADLESFMQDQEFGGTTGIGHTRWATHGEPSDTNAHPHVSMNGLFTIVHNGIIENYAELKEGLVSKGYSFKSETDTEVLVNLIEYFYTRGTEVSAEDAVTLALSNVTGTYGIAVLCTRESDKLIAARKGSPLSVGIGNGQLLIASDATAIAGFINQVVYLNDGDLVVLKKDSFTLTSTSNKPISIKISNIDINIGEIGKGSFEHYMLKEIHEQPKVIEDTLRGRLQQEKSDIMLGGLISVFPELLKSERIIIVGCGTSWHAALIGEYLIEEFARIPVEVEYASEFRYRNPVIGKNDVVILISQSGETADTLAALRLAKEQGALVIGICNVVGSALARDTDAGIYTHAGIEIGVASTKAFTAQITVLTLLALKLAWERKTIGSQQYRQHINELAQIPDKIRNILLQSDKIRIIAEKYKHVLNCVYLGRGNLFPVALEGALKMKEISYIHAEGYAAGEMKHGPIALVDEQLPVIALAPKDANYEKMASSIQEVKARKGTLIAIISEADREIRDWVHDFIEIPDSLPALIPMLGIIPLQLLAYHIAVYRECNVDQPRNLAKSVTVE